MDLTGFDATQVEPLKAFEPIPTGRYTAMIIETEKKPTKKGDGSYLQLKFQIIDGEFKNRTLYARLNLDNPNPTAVEIAQAELSAICRATGKLTPTDSIELMNIRLDLQVVRKRRKDNGELTNEIKGYFPHDADKVAEQRTQEATGGSIPPWKK